MGNIMKHITKTLALIVFAVFIAAGCASDPNVESAKLHIGNQDWDAAIESSRTAVETNPENPDAFFYLADALRRKAMTSPFDSREDLLAEAYTNYKKAEELYDKQTISSSEANLIEINLVQTWADEFNTAVEASSGNFAEATEEELNTTIIHLRNAIAILPDSHYVKTVLGEAYLTAGQYDNVEKIIGRKIESGTADRDDFIVLANARLSSGDTDGAFEVMTDIVEQYPDDIAVIEWIAFYHIERDNTDEAMQTVQGLIDSNPEELRYRLLFRDIFQEEINNYIEEAEAILESVPPINAEIRRMARERDRDEAAIRAKMAEVDELISRAEELFEKSDELAAIVAQQFHDYVELKPNDVTGWLELGILSRNRAVSYFELRDNTDDFEQAAVYDAKAKEILAETAEYFEQVVAIEEENTQAWTILFQIYSNLNRMEEALEAQERAGLGG